MVERRERARYGTIVSKEIPTGVSSTEKLKKLSKLFRKTLLENPPGGALDPQTPFH